MPKYETNAEGSLSNTRETVVDILARHTGLERDQITPDCAVAALGLTSLALVECLFEIEETFDISIPYNANTETPDAFDLTSIASIVCSIDRLRAQHVQPA